MVQSRFRLLLCSLSLFTPLAVCAEEGMWMPQQVPQLAEDLAARGFALDPAKVADLLGDPMGAIVSLGGCSASFVSPEGLIATNHHCVYNSIQFNATPERDLITLGFQAKTRAEELPSAPGTYVYVTSAIRDVTAEVLAAASAATTDAERKRLVERSRRELVDRCEAPGGVRCNVGTFFEGSQFLLTTQTEIQDVRLVYAPAHGIGNYGGEVDNWMWPRHTGDFAFLRAYVAADGKPAAPAATNVPYKPKHWLTVAQAGVQEGDFVWIAGYPGRTFRYRTATEVVQARDFSMPTFRRYATNLNNLLETENLRGKEVEIRNYSRIRGNANTLKKFEGVLLAMDPPSGEADPVEAQRRSRETALAARAAGGDAVASAAVDALTAIDTLVAAAAQHRERNTVLDWLERSSPMLNQAVRLYRGSLERTKPDLDRADGFRDRDRARFIQGVTRTQRSIELASDRVGLRAMVVEANGLPAGQRIAALDAALAATGAATPGAQIDAFLDHLYGSTKIADLEARLAMAEEPTAALEARGDSMLNFAKALWPEQQAREEAEANFDGAMLRLRPLYLAGLATLEGGRLYPDANSTLRITFCNVGGYSPRDGVEHTARTTLPGMVAKATGVEPFNAPQALLEAARGTIPAGYTGAGLGGTVAVNFLATCDITGGNSGSAVLDAKGHLVGLAFDGNWEGVVSDYLFLDERTRTISVDATYMRYVMDVVDGAHHLLAEMGLPVLSQATK